MGKVTAQYVIYYERRSICCLSVSIFCCTRTCHIVSRTYFLASFTSLSPGCHWSWKGHYATSSPGRPVPCLTLPTACTNTLLSLTQSQNQMSDTVTEHRQAFSEENRAHLSTEERLEVRWVLTVEWLTKEVKCKRPAGWDFTMILCDWIPSMTFRVWQKKKRHHYLEIISNF